MKDRLDKNNDITSNSKQIEILKKNFPNCFDKYGKFIPEKLNEIVSKEVDITNESYSLNWLGKSYARLLANQEVTTMLKEDKEHNNKEENKNSDNIYIEGDNLEVLKHMVNAYSEKIKMIYIDPPYNTKSENFIYEDNRKFTKEELSKLANIDEEEAQRILDFTNSKSNSHSAWLTFMYPRLYVARELLKEEGVIFISIDDNEQAQLKLLCDEVFGEENFVGDLIRRTRIGGGSMSKYISQDHENTICYCKSIINLNRIYKPFNEEQNSRYKYEDEKGKYFWDTFMRNRQGSSNNYDIKAPDGTIINGNFIYKEEKYLELLKENEIKFIKNKENWSIQIKQRKNERGVIFRSLLMDFPNQKGTAEVKEILGKNEIFSYPKPTSFLKELVNSFTSKDDIILDFFSGSATTAHAVIDLNASDNGNRKFIMVNLPESIDKESNKSAYDFCVNELKEEPVITTIGKERIRRAAKKIYEDNQDKEYIGGIDLGFKVYKTVDVVKTNYFDNLEKLEVGSQGNLLNDSLSVEDIESLLLTWKLYDGIEFNEEFNIVDFNGYNGYYIDNKLYLMDKGFDNSKIKLLLEKLDDDSTFNVRKIILFAVNFNSKELMEIEESVKGYKNKKEIELEIEKRY